jgi:ribonuclease D
MRPSPALVTLPADLAAVVAGIDRAGAFALDIEFVSASRYVGELALVQVAWGAPEEPEVAAIDPLAVDLAPLLARLEAADVPTVLHAAQGDLSVLAAHAGVAGHGILDTQVAAAFAGLGDQVGYAALVEALLGLRLDKAQQFTRWLDRPLAAEQLRYARDDVRYLPRLWQLLAARLETTGRRPWAAEESDRIARTAASRPPPEEAWLRVGGWQRLGPRERGALRALAAWRERRALAANRPPSWIVKDAVLLRLAREPPPSLGELAAAGLPPATRQRHGEELLAAILQGRREPLAATAGPSRAARQLGKRLHAFLGERCRRHDLPTRFAASRAEAEVLAAWWLDGERGAEPDLPLLAGWRRRELGEAALAWLAAGLAGQASGDTSR